MINVPDEEFANDIADILARKNVLDLIGQELESLSFNELLEVLAQLKVSRAMGDD